jgi:hypothetical protein
MENTPPQQNQPKMTPKFFFLSLGVIVSLITVVTSFLTLAFDVLDKKFPDVLNAVYQYGYASYNYDAIRSSIATLIIVFPVFILLSYLWSKTVKAGLGSIDAAIRKWMIYLILFLSSIVLVVDLVTLVRYFVSGEITSRFIYKVLITLLVAVFVGVYYIFEITNREKFLKMKVGMTSAFKATAWVVLLIAFSFSVIGSPKSQRALRLDDKRVQDLISIQWSVINFWQQKERLPETLAEVSNPLSGTTIPVDPEFEKGLVYEYKKTADMTFELCATFSADMPKGWQEYSNGGGIAYPMTDERDVATSAIYPGVATNESWDHKIGRTCYERTIDKDIYPPYSKSTGSK